MTILITCVGLVDVILSSCTFNICIEGMETTGPCLAACWSSVQGTGDLVGHCHKRWPVSQRGDAGAGVAAPAGGGFGRCWQVWQLRRKRCPNLPLGVIFFKATQFIALPPKWLLSLAVVNQLRSPTTGLHEAQWRESWSHEEWDKNCWDSVPADLVQELLAELLYTHTHSSLSLSLLFWSRFTTSDYRALIIIHSLAE